MKIIHGSEENFDNLVNNGIVLVDFYADWCGPCKMLATQLEQLEDNRYDAQIVKINVDENQELSRKYRIMSIPALMLFKDGKLIDNKVGYTTKDEIIEWINNNK